MANPFKIVTMRNLAGAIFDARSSADETPLGSFSWKQNVSISPDNKLCRALGWTRLYSENLDYHTQPGDREPITMLFHSTSNDGVRRLFAATKGRILVMNEVTKTWDVIGSGFGVDGNDSLTQVRFHAAELQEKVIFTNNFDPPQIHTLGTNSVATITSLLDLQGNPPNTDTLTLAKAIVSWQGFIFFGNTFEDGVRYASRIRWSHLNDATFFTEGQVAPDGGTSLADFVDLTYGDEVLAMIPLGGFLYIFTNRGIERCSLSVNVDAVLNQSIVTLLAASAYREQETQAKCLAYPNAIVSDGASFWYAGRDAIYRFTPGQDAEPERVEWVHRSTSVIFKDAATRINSGACESPIMGYYPASNEDDTAGGEMQFSWPHGGDGVNQHTLSITNRRSADISLRYNTTAYLDYGSTALVNFRSDTLGIGDCNQLVDQISCNGEDWCLKLLNTGSGREMFSGGVYTMRGYIARLIFCFPFERFSDRKVIRSFMVEREPQDENDTAVFYLRIGVSDSALDPNPPNGNKCAVIWMPLKKQGMGCRYTKTAEAYKAAKIYPSNPVAWSFLASGRFLYADFSILAADGSAPVTGNCSVSRFEVDARLE